MTPNPTKVFVPQCLTFTLSVVLANCGAKTESDSTSGNSTNVSSGGAVAQGGNSEYGGGYGGSSFEAGKTAISTGGSPWSYTMPTSTIGSSNYDGGLLNCHCGYTSDAPCNEGALWTAISGATHVIGYCYQLDPDAGSEHPWGTVVLDDQGQVVDNDGLQGSAKQVWLETLENMRWLCLANRTLYYTCSVAV
jgi:hypothetical protein